MYDLISQVKEIDINTVNIFLTVNVCLIAFKTLSFKYTELNLLLLTLLFKTKEVEKYLPLESSLRLANVVVEITFSIAISFSVVFPRLLLSQPTKKFFK